jgi:hypothetical protein
MNPSVYVKGVWNSGPVSPKPIAIRVNSKQMDGKRAVTCIATCDCLNAVT